MGRLTGTKWLAEGVFFSASRLSSPMFAYHLIIV